MDNVWARFFPIFLEKDLLKVDKILGLTFFRQEKTSKDSKRLFSIYCSWVLWSMDCLQLPFIRLEEAVSWAPRFLTRKIWLKNEVYLRQTNLKVNVCRNYTFQGNTRKNATWRRRLISRNRITIFSALHAKNDTTNLFGYKLGESTENNKALLFFSGKETIQTFSGSN